jgi:hypothetical protein
MPDSFLPFVDITCVSKAYVLDNFGKRNFANLNNDMKRICHQAKSMDTVSEPFNAFLQQHIKPEPVPL